MSKLEMKLEIMEMKISDLEKLVAIDMIDNDFVPFIESDVKTYWSERL